MPIKINGATSGSVTLQAPAVVGGDLTMTLQAGAWTSYTPTFSGGTWAVGNGTFSGVGYTQIGKTVIYAGVFVFGSTTVKDATNALNISLPVNCRAGYTGSYYGAGQILDSGTNNHPILINPSSTTTAQFRAMVVSGSLVVTNGFTTTNPITWATNDTVSWTLIYEAA